MELLLLSEMVNTLHTIIEPEKKIFFGECPFGAFSQ
jgi:hypothetical protein